uniref:ubiquitinyl hydrolase 1 n=1 Tax=Scleropages formosus TaxID=113540 RepID=A0A8C9R0Y3_SCLFO
MLSSLLTEYASKLNSKNMTSLVVTCMNSKLLPKVMSVDALQEITKEEAELLQALDKDKDRFKCFEDRKELDFALSLSEDSPVEVDVNGEWCEGMVRYAGGITELDRQHPITGMFFGIELKEKHKGKGQTDGTYRGKKYFACGRDCGVFVPFTRLRDSAPKPLDPLLPWKGVSGYQEEPLVVGERVTFFTDDDRGRHGILVGQLKGTPYRQLLRTLTTWLTLMVAVLSFVCRWSYFSSPNVSAFDAVCVCADRGADELVPGRVAPLTSDKVLKMLMGDMKGIQGHCNSCYMDSALFRSGHRALLLEPTAGTDLTGLQHHAWPFSIVRRAQGPHAAANLVLAPRTELLFSRYTHSKWRYGVFHKHRTASRRSTGKKVQESYYYQIFLDQNHSLVLPTVRQLLEHSFWSNSLRLAEVPACLILQMPRFGKTFKMFNKIIPTLELDISDLLLDNPQECILCGQLAELECNNCFVDDTFGNTGFKQLCGKCSLQVHSHPKRSSHKPSHLRIPDGFRPSAIPPKEKLQLFAVLCIETSHYVSFVRHGRCPEDWVFFDSMADRQGDQDGYNIPRVQACPEVARYLEMPLGELAALNPRDMEGVAKRLFCDAYMYLYESPRMGLYH